MKIVHIIDSFTKVNYGIWNAVANTAMVLSENYGHDSFMIYPISDYSYDLPSITGIPISEIKVKSAISIMNEHNFIPSDTIIVTHGCWQFPTRWGHNLKQNGFKWIYVPHGMLEPWSLRQKKLKKRLYFKFIEGKYVKKADSVRAVGKPEFTNLKQYFSNIQLIPNGVECPKIIPDPQLSKVVYLYMARLHHKKGVDLLIDAWKQSNLFEKAGFELHIAGPDDGLGDFVRKNATGNIKYLGAIYNELKESELTLATFYILPSYSEGFPTSVIEAMSYGLIPIITEGCNFPEAIDHGVAKIILPEIQSIIYGIENISHLKPEEISKIRTNAMGTEINMLYLITAW